VEDLLTMGDGVNYEVVAGKLVKRNPGEDVGAESSVVAMDIGYHLNHHARSKGIAAKVGGADLIVKTFPDPNTGRRPDAALILLDELPERQVPRGILQVPPPLVVEVVSPNDAAEEVLDKAEVWHSGGVRIVWVVFPSHRRIFVSGGRQHRLAALADDELTLEDVLTGFSMKVRNLLG
jgi:Uma2 family endonuclease